MSPASLQWCEVIATQLLLIFFKLNENGLFKKAWIYYQIGLCLHIFILAEYYYI